MGLSIEWKNVLHWKRYKLGSIGIKVWKVFPIIIRIIIGQPVYEVENLDELMNILEVLQSDTA